MYLSDHTINIHRKDYVLKQYEIKPFDSFPAAEKNENRLFTALQTAGVENAVFHQIDGKGNYRKNEGSDDIMERSREKAAMLEREAYEKGFAQGEKDGLELGALKALKIVENIENLLDEIGRLRTDIVKRYENDILGLICSVAEKVVHHQVGLNGATIRETVIKAIQLATEKRSILLKINPEEFDYIDRLRPEFFQRFNQLESMEVVSNPSVRRGGCFLETPFGDVDARVETQLEMIRQCLEEAYTGNGDD
jgi:flagellar assembly protein FliH